ncbi:MAG: hypothetical protein K8F91_22250, partial [Candidatus Obscuribacterales bacterium]|nr:hypothetical protein [Candidatus Obscuribacterales bacterium]
MYWPTPQEYNEAIQTPLISFVDPELARGTLALTPIGIPWAMTGAFASVYKMTTEMGDWAIRCFLTHRPDQGERYQKISHFVSMDELDETVAFHYIDQGIKVHGTWYPILKMEWVYGDTLDVYLQKYYRDRKRVAELLWQFDALALNLDQAGIAHGDLQHGNILVSDRGLRLVDYDALFVPELAGKMSLELGHPNYQHPNRTEHHYDTTVDNFSCWLIHYSLQALSIDPDLYEISGGGDDCILFRRTDLRQPEASELFDLLSNHPSAEISSGAALLMRMLWANPQCVPELHAPQEEYDLLPTVKPDFDDSSKQQRRDLLYYVQADTNASTDKDLYLGTRFDADSGILTTNSPKPIRKKKQGSTIISLFKMRCRKIVEFVQRDVFTGTWYSKRIKQGDLYLRAGRYYESGDIYLELYRFYNPTWLKPHLFDLYLKLGYSFAMQQNFSLAQNYFLLALREADERDNNDK